VIRGVALGADPEQLASPDRAADDIDAGALDLAKDGAGGAQQALAGFRGHEAARRAREERDPYAPLECPEGVAQGGLRDVEARRRARDGAFVGDGDEHAELAGFEVHGGRMSVSRDERLGTRGQRRAINHVHGYRENNVFDLHGPARHR
jgi:hypothetical protein